MGTQPLPKKGAEPPIFGSSLLWQNGRMDQDGTWHGGGPWSRPHCIRRGPSFRERGIAVPPLSAHVYCGHGRPSPLLLSSCTNGHLTNGTTGIPAMITTGRGEEGPVKRDVQTKNGTGDNRTHTTGVDVTASAAIAMHMHYISAI